MYYIYSIPNGSVLTNFQSGVHGLLDVARQTYKEANDDVYKHIEEINSK